MQNDTQEHPQSSDRIAAAVTFSVVPTWLVLSDVSDRALRLYAVLAHYAGAKGAAWPARSTLARDLRCSVSSIERALRELTALGAVSITQRRDAAGDLTSSLYTVHVTPHGGAVRMAVDNSVGVASRVTLPSVTGEPTVASRVTHRTRTNELDTPLPPLTRGSCAAHESPQPNCRGCGTNPRALRAAREGRASWPTWCGQCDETTRLLTLDDGRPKRCPSCHPLRAVN